MCTYSAHKVGSEANVSLCLDPIHAHAHATRMLLGHGGLLEVVAGHPEPEGVGGHLEPEGVGVHLHPEGEVVGDPWHQVVPGHFQEEGHLFPIHQD